ncbi:YnbE family lipoprotein [Glaesserella sp.]|uniref:YnbE family lipoprotein n=1 Tax=Glaesserella sp. TaxID=2094731 RepID=UPI00359F74FB
MKTAYSLFAIFCLNLTACTPTVKLETPEEGITINMNVVVDHKIEVQMDEKSRAVIKTIDNTEAKK